MNRRPVCLALLCAACLAAPASAADPTPPLRWGGDQEGGGPYVYSMPDNPDHLIGFEVEMMDALAQRLGRKAEFVQCDFKQLPDLLRRGGIDVIVNGYELTRAHRATKVATIPYYVYELQLIARRNDPSISGWDALKAAPGRPLKKVGVLEGTVAETYCNQFFGVGTKQPLAEVISYPGTTQALEEVVSGKLDATVADVPAALFYANRYPALHFAAPPVERGSYVIYLSPGPKGEALRDQLDAGLLALMRDGSLRRIYQRYGIWNGTQEDYFFQHGAGETTESVEGTGSTQAHGWSVVHDTLPLFLQAAGMTVLLSVLSMPLAMAIGLLVALGRTYGPSPLRWLLTAYVEFLRGTPLLLQLFVIFYVLPNWGIRIDAVPAAILGLAINYSAYEAEIYRAGLLAIPIGQMEAALALGMSRGQALRRIVVPQAVRLVVPPVTNDFIALFKDTSVCSAITVVELTKLYSIQSNSTGAYIELAVVTGLLYFAMSYPLSLVARRLERRAERVHA